MDIHAEGGELLGGKVLRVHLRPNLLNYRIGAKQSVVRGER
jgi:hypothetical protein